MLAHNTKPPSLQHAATLSLGSNLGDRFAALTNACQAVTASNVAKVLAISPIYETEPIDPPPACPQLDYLNCIIIIITQLTAPQLLEFLQSIEIKMGRLPTSQPNMPRCIDIDIITFDDLQITLPTLTLPHPRARKRRFVLEPLADLRPDFIFPGDNRPIHAILSELPLLPRVVRYHQ